MRYIKGYIKGYNESVSNKKRVYVDMDDTMCDYTSSHTSQKSDKLPYPQSQVGFFIKLEPMENAIESINSLMDKYDVWVLTRPSVKNTHCYSEKAEWIKKHFGEEMLSKLIICPNKSLLKGDYLIDDRTEHGNSDFDGELIQFGTEKFPNWIKVVEYLL